jgi:hypothetical protein
MNKNKKYTEDTLTNNERVFKKGFMHIATICAARAGAKFNDIFSNNRNKRNVKARQLAVFFAKKMQENGRLPKVDDEFIGYLINRDRCTIWHSFKAINELIEIELKYSKKSEFVNDLNGIYSEIIGGNDTIIQKTDHKNIEKFENKRKQGQENISNLSDKSEILKDDYEILADIADLTEYKHEYIRLKKQLNRTDIAPSHIKSRIEYLKLKIREAYLHKRIDEIIRELNIIEQRLQVYNKTKLNVSLTI